MNTYEADMILQRLASRALRWKEAYSGEIPGTPDLDKTIPNEEAARIAVISLAEEDGWNETEISEAAAALMVAYICGTKPSEKDMPLKARRLHNDRSVNVIALWGYHTLF